MPLAGHVLDALAAHLVHAVELISASPRPPRELGAFRAWLGSLPDAAIGDVLRELPPGNELVASALRELRGSGPAPREVRGSGPVPPAPPSIGDAPLITSIGIPVIDRLQVWSHLLELHSSRMRRILLVRGAAGAGKTHMKWVVEELCARLGDGHQVLTVDLEDLRTVERAVDLMFANLGLTMQLRPRALTDNSDLAWARTSAMLVFKRLVAELAGTTPWLVFDHFDRMPRSDETAVFLNELTQLVASQKPSAPTAMRLVLIDKREVPPNATTRTVTVDLERVSHQDVRLFVRGCHPHLSEAELDAEVTALVGGLSDGELYMHELRERIAGMVAS
jgi:hypothetical protein